MTANAGTIDRIIRVLVGLALIAAAVGLFRSAYQTVWGWVGVIPLATGLIGWCPLYALLGVKTCETAATGNT